MSELFPALTTSGKSVTYHIRCRTGTYPGGPDTTTACVRALRDDGPSATLRRPSLLETEGLDASPSLELNKGL